MLLRDAHKRCDPQALLCTDLGQDPLQIVRWFVQRLSADVGSGPYPTIKCPVL